MYEPAKVCIHSTIPTGAQVKMFMGTNFHVLCSVHENAKEIAPCESFPLYMYSMYIVYNVHVCVCLYMYFLKPYLMVCHPTDTDYSMLQHPQPLDDDDDDDDYDVDRGYGNLEPITEEEVKSQHVQHIFMRFMRS